MDSWRENSLRDNPHFKICGLHNGRIICLCKSSGALATLNPHSNSEILRIAPRAWWVARGWRVVKPRGTMIPDWHGATNDLSDYAESIGLIDLATYEELLRQRARKRYVDMRARFDPLPRAP